MLIDPLRKHLGDKKKKRKDLATININTEPEQSRDLLKAGGTLLFRRCLCLHVIMHALISCIDRFTVASGA